MKNLEVGNIYAIRVKKTRLYYLAVTETVLFTLEHGMIETIKAEPGHKVERKLSVNFLCTEWGVNTAQIDAVTAIYLNPSSHKNVGTRQRIKRMGGPPNDDLTETRLRITHKLSL